MHRIRSSNRLLSQSNAAFRDKMIALMHSHNDETQLDTVSDDDIQFMYKRIQAFVRGYNQVNLAKKSGDSYLDNNANKYGR